MKLSVSTALSAVLLSTAVTAQTACSVFSGSIPSNPPTGAYTKVLSSFYHATVEGVTATLDPLTRHFEVVNNSARRRVVCHFYQGEICFWVNAGDDCIHTLASRFVNADNPGFIRTWTA